MRRIACALALLFAACGDGPERTARVTPTPTPGMIAPVVSAASALPATASAGRLIATATVRGVAEPRTRIVVSAGCEEEACATATLAAPGGAFEAEVQLAADARRPVATIVVAYEDRSASIDSDRVAVELTEQPTPTPTPAANARTVVVIGDSLAVGMRPYLSEFLGGWQVLVDARGGRRLGEGMRRFDAARPPEGRIVYAFSLFTNDPPDSVGALEAAVRRSTSHGCAVWATITGANEANARLQELAASTPDRLKVVRWAERSQQEASWLKADGIHGTPAGYRNRAALYAAAIKSCTE